MSKKSSAILSLHQATFRKPSGQSNNFGFCRKNGQTWGAVAVELSIDELIRWAINTARSDELKNADINMFIPLPSHRAAPVTDAAISRLKEAVSSLDWQPLPEPCRRIIKDRVGVTAPISLIPIGDDKWGFEDSGSNRSPVARIRDWSVLANVVLRDLVMYDVEEFIGFHVPQAPTPELEFELRKRFCPDTVVDSESTQKSSTSVTAAMPAPTLSQMERLRIALITLGQSTPLLEDSSAELDASAKQRLRVISKSSQALLEQLGVENQVVNVELLQGAEQRALKRLEEVVAQKRRELDELFRNLVERESRTTSKEAELQTREQEFAKIDEDLSELRTQLDERLAAVLLREDSIALREKQLRELHAQASVQASSIAEKVAALAAESVRNPDQTAAAKTRETS